MNLKQLVYGVATFIPGVSHYRDKGTGGTDSARYCYTVWGRHAVMAQQSGLCAQPRVVAELGPGDSLGIGLAALISGCEKYYAFDVVEHADVQRNIKVFDALVELFKAREALPGNSEFPKVFPYLDCYTFPDELFTRERLDAALAPARLLKIRNTLADLSGTDAMIEYRAPWHSPSVIDSASVDMIFSQAVLEHVDDLHGTYAAMYRWLKPGGYLSHLIDYKCHGTADEWNGHWTYSDLKWKLIRGKRAYLLNREPHSTHQHLLHRQGFKVIHDLLITRASHLTRAQLAPRFVGLTDADLVTSAAFIQAVKAH